MNKCTVPINNPETTDTAIGLVGHQSSKKPIRDCFSRCRSFLKLFTVLAFTVWWSKLFHLLTSRSVKKCRLTFNLLLCLVSFYSWPLRCFVVDNSNIDSIGIPEKPLTILNTSMRLAVLRLSSKLQSHKRLSLTVWQLGEARNHSCETMLHSLNQCFVFLITRWPHWCTVFNMWAYQWFIQVQQDLFRLINNCSVHHT